MIRTYEFPDQNMFATCKLLKAGEGVVADTWWTVLTGATPRVVAHIVVPVFGDTPDRAINATGTVIHELAETVPSIWNGEGSPAIEAPSSYHVDAHLAWHGDRLGNMDLEPVEDVAGMYRLLSDFRVKNPAERIRKYLKANSVRVVHEYIADARDQGLIPRYGKGKSYV